MKEENFTERTLERIRSGASSEKSNRSKKLSRFIIFADIAVIVLIIFFLQNRKGDGFYQSVKIQKDKISVRISVTKDPNSLDYLYSLMIQSKNEKKIILSFEKEMATIVINSPNNLITTLHFGKKVTKFELLPGERKNFIQILNIESIEDHILAFPQDKTEVPKSLLQFSKDYMNLENNISVNFKNDIKKAKISFKSEIK